MVDLPPAGTRSVVGDLETFNVGHINCQSCERTIRTLLSDIDGVEHVTADHRTDTVAVTFDEQHLSRDAVVAELAGIGYAPIVP